jgi:hypothetical protein
MRHEHISTIAAETGKKLVLEPTDGAEPVDQQLIIDAHRGI